MPRKRIFIHPCFNIFFHCWYFSFHIFRKVGDLCSELDLSIWDTLLWRSTSFYRLLFMLTFDNSFNNYSTCFHFRSPSFNVWINVKTICSLAILPSKLWCMEAVKKFKRRNKEKEDPRMHHIWLHISASCHSPPLVHNETKPDQSFLI